MTEQERAECHWMAAQEMDFYDSLEDQLYGEDVEQFQHKVRMESALIAGITAIAIALVWRK